MESVRVLKRRTNRARSTGVTTYDRKGKAFRQSESSKPNSAGSGEAHALTRPDRGHDEADIKRSGLLGSRSVLPLQRTFRASVGDAGGEFAGYVGTLKDSSRVCRPRFTSHKSGGGASWHFQVSSARPAGNRRAVCRTGTSSGLSGFSGASRQGAAAFDGGTRRLHRR